MESGNVQERCTQFGGVDYRFKRTSSIGGAAILSRRKSCNLRFAGPHGTYERRQHDFSNSFWLCIVDLRGAVVLFPCLAHARRSRSIGSTENVELSLYAIAVSSLLDYVIDQSDILSRGVLLFLLDRWPVVYWRSY